MFSATDRLVFAQSLIDGAYDLESWHMESGIMHAPLVTGRFMLHKGALATILHNRVEEDAHSTLAMYGYYTLNESEFAYCYDHPMSIRKTPAGFSISTTPPWEGMRTFVVTCDDVSVNLRAKGGQGFLFTRIGLQYFESHALLRTWRRVAL